jgi:hypothetical protein
MSAGCDGDGLSDDRATDGRTRFAAQRTTCLQWLRSLDSRAKDGRSDDLLRYSLTYLWAYVKISLEPTVGPRRYPKEIT